MRSNRCAPFSSDKAGSSLCDCDTFDAPEAFHCVWRKARKEHRCCECRHVILAGAIYEYASGIWDGSPNSYKTCDRCVRLREAHIQAEKESSEEERLAGPLHQRTWIDPPCTPVFGQLISMIGECCREDRRYVTHFRRAWRVLCAADLRGGPQP